MSTTASKPAPKGRSLKERSQDDLVMSTNSSSIVSKRSVERIYYPSEPHFFRFFVSRFQRRAPLINRGYHLRMRVVDTAVREFLARRGDGGEGKRKIVVNLGCGSDVLPWQTITRYPTLCHHPHHNPALFIDIDFPDLLAQKGYIVRKTPELASLLTDFKDTAAHSHPRVVLQSSQYVQIGCDLRELAVLQEALESLVAIEDCEFLFVAEVSVTYMETEAADEVVRWASGVGQVDFCLLEQILPDGPSHPFASTMLRHFDKLKTPLRSVSTYTDVPAQQARFSKLGWHHVEAETLWTAWASDRYFSPEDRRKLDLVEPFDEWEEFAIFASHYCVLRASNVTAGRIGEREKTSQPLSLDRVPASLEFHNTGTRNQRRFGAAMVLNSNRGDPSYLAHSFGLGSSSRLRSLDFYTTMDTVSSRLNISPHGPVARMCHAVVPLGAHGNFLCGGRKSPANALRDCWLLDDFRKTWQRLEDLPWPLYRHAAVRLGSSNMILVVGGKTGSEELFRDCLMYSPDIGWTRCEILGPAHKPVFGAVLLCFQGGKEPRGEFHGLLLGGMTHDGTLSEQALAWTLRFPGGDGYDDKVGGEAMIEFSAIPGWGDRLDGGERMALSRFGASAFAIDAGKLVVVGGVVKDRILKKREEIVLVDFDEGSMRVRSVDALEGDSPLATGPTNGTGIQNGDHTENLPPRPLLVGISTTCLQDRDQARIIVLGGGGTCFSMGTHWNRGCYGITINLSGDNNLSPQGENDAWKLSQTIELSDPNIPNNPPHSSPPTNPPAQHGKPTLVPIARTTIDSQNEFASMLSTGLPFIITNLNLSCVPLWTPSHLVSRIGADRPVVVHEADTSSLDFNAKNFRYVTKRFGEFMEALGGETDEMNITGEEDEAENGKKKNGKMYMRALSEENPAGKPADLKMDFPELGKEFVLPEALEFVERNQFSSVLRISGDVRVWLHYDVMANIYCQIAGHKRMILFPPSNVTSLSFTPGASTSSLDVFSALDGVPSSLLASTRPHEAILHPGDVLFLPPLWPHTGAALSGWGVAVNVFFRSLVDGGYAAGRDVYGNRDLAVYERGRREVGRLAEALGRAPGFVRAFYGGRLVEELRGLVGGL